MTGFEVREQKHSSRRPGSTKAWTHADQRIDQVKHRRKTTATETSTMQHKEGVYSTAPSTDNLQHAVLWVARSSNAPTVRDQRTLRRCVKSLSGTSEIGREPHPKEHAKWYVMWMRTWEDIQIASVAVTEQCRLRGSPYSPISIVQHSKSLSSCKSELHGALGSPRSSAPFRCPFITLTSSWTFHAA